MKREEIAAKAEEISHPFRVTDGKNFRLKDIDPGSTGDFDKGDKKRAKEGLKQGVDALADLQEMLYAHNQHSVLLIFQATDAAGKDGAIEHVMSGVNPQGCQVFSFKTPSTEELDHNFLWRCMKREPERGRIGIFNRSYYEEVLVVRVHPEYLGGQNLPDSLVGEKIWEGRYEDIRNYEKYLARNGTAVLKFFLHLSKEEQLNRFLARLDDPAKNWKFSEGDLKERGHWDEYQEYYEEMIRQTATEDAPWYVIPADNKWFTRITVAAAIIDRLIALDLSFPEVSDAKREELSQIREKLAKGLESDEKR